MTAGPHSSTSPTDDTPLLPNADEEPVVQGCIFKVGDDCRQDVLALQMIRCYRDVCQEAGVDIYLYPYNVISTRPGCGVIELVPDTKSLDQLGKSQENSLLYDYFIKTHGQEDTLTYQRARRNFVRSMAGYAIISYLLQIKDRHNGNILIDKEGHLVHIDFGFIFRISPGGDMRFERAPFKFTGEMVQVMGSMLSESYQLFQTLCIKGYLVARRNMDALVTIAEGMQNSGLPCFKYGGKETIAHLRERFQPDLTERQAAEHMRMLVQTANTGFSRITTKGYDVVQALQQGIAH